MADKAGIRLKQAVQQKAENPKDTHSFAQSAQFAQFAQPCAKEEQKDEKDSIITCNNDNNIMNINNIDNSNHYHTMQEEFINAQGCASAQTAQTAQIPGFHHLGIQAGSYEMRSESRLRPS